MVVRPEKANSASQPSSTPKRPHVSLELSRHSVQIVALSATICTEWEIWVGGLGRGEVARDVGEDVGFSVAVEADVS